MTSCQKKKEKIDEIHRMNNFSVGGTLNVCFKLFIMKHKNISHFTFILWVVYTL